MLAFARLTPHRWALSGLGLALLVLFVLPSAQINMGASQLRGLVGSYTGGGWVPCDASGNPLPSGDPGLNSDGSAALMHTGNQPAADNTYPVPKTGAPSWWYGCYSPQAPGGGPYPGRGAGLSTSSTAGNFVTHQTGGISTIGYYDPVYFAGDRPGSSPTPPNLNGTVTTGSDTLTCYFLWTGPGPAPTQATFIIQTSVSATASVGYGSSGKTSGLSSTATATLGSDTVTANAGDAGSPGSQTGGSYRAQQVSPSGNIATVSLPASVSTTTNNNLAYATWTGSSSSTWYYNGPGAGPTSAGASATSKGSVRPAPGSVTGDSTENTANWDSTHPRFFSGTDCQVNAHGVAANGFITHMQVTIGGTLVAEYDDTSVTALTSNQGTAPNKVQYQKDTSQTSFTLTTMFDSTHFANNSQVPVQLEVIDSKGCPYYFNIKGPAVNNAFLMYNNNGVPYGGNGSVFDSNGVQEAKAAAQDVSAALTPSHITPSALDSTDNVAGIEGKLSNPASQYTVFFAADHGGININGNPYVLGDCLATPSNAAHWLTDSNISTAVNQAAAISTQPPYNFVYLHTCNSGNTTGFANDFGISVTLGGDRGMIGFTNNPKINTSGNLSTPPGYAEDGELAVTAQNTLYTQTLWQQLLKGYAAHAAIANAKTLTGGAQEFYEPTQQGQQGVVGANNSEVATLMAGSDSNYTLANAVFGGLPGQWFQ